MPSRRNTMSLLGTASELAIEVPLLSRGISVNRGSHCFHAFCPEDEERSGAGCAWVDGFDHAFVLELLAANLVVDERSELVGVADRTSWENDHASSSRTWAW